jgi:hypothetical protein
MLVILITLVVLNFVQKRKTAVGRIEMTVLFLVYGLTVVFEVGLLLLFSLLLFFVFVFDFAFEIYTYS